MAKTSKKASGRKPSTALARIEQSIARIPKVIAKRPDLNLEVLNDDIAIGALGDVDIKFTAHEEKILSQEVPIDRVQVKPTGQPYLSHPDYTRWFNLAFGRGGWALVPIAKPMKVQLESGVQVIVPYVLKVHGKTAAFAFGEQEYHTNNRDQTYGDAAEATVASALRRCAKRLGVGLELWDRSWLDNFLHEHCLMVKVEWIGKRDGKKMGAFRWRLKTARPLPDEVPARTEKQAATQNDLERQYEDDDDRKVHAAPAAGWDKEPISGDQLTRLYAIANAAGRKKTEIKPWLLSRFGYASSRQIRKGDYNTIVSAIEAPGELR